MADIKKIQIQGVDYDIKDAAAREEIARLKTRKADDETLGMVKVGTGFDRKSDGTISVDITDIEEDADGVIHLLDNNGAPIGNGAKVSAKVDDLILEQEGDEKKLYLSYQGEIIGDGVVLPAGGGGGGGGSTSIVRLANNTGTNAISVTSGEAANISFTFTSTEDDVPTGSGTCKILVGGALKRTFTIENGVSTTVNVASYLSAGANTVRVTCIDIYGNSRSLTFTITVVELRIESTFDNTVAQTGDITFKYTPYGIGISKIIHFVVDNVQYSTVTTQLSAKQATEVISARTHGVHTIEVYATATLDGEALESNHLKYEVVCLADGNTNPMIAVDFDKTTAVQGEMISIPYTVYDPAALTSDIELNIYAPNGDLYSSQALTVSRARQTWKTRRYPTGAVIFEIKYSSTVYRRKTVTVSASDIDVSAVTNDLELHLSAAGRSNNEATPNTWVDGTTTTTFTNVNWKSTGWIEDADGDVALRLNGGATAAIDFKLFQNDFKQYGKTIEFEFAVRDVNNRNAEIIKCMSDNIGLLVTADKAVLKSGMSTIECRFRDEEKIRVGFVVESTADDRLLLVYLNGILSGAVQYPATDLFSQETPVGISLGSPYCGIDIYSIRSYTTALTSANMVNNYIADTTDIVDKTELYEANNIYAGALLSYDILKTRIPVVTIIGTLPQSKGDKQDVTFKYENPDDSSLNFTDACKLDVQGTSSQYYVVKNYKAKFSTSHTHAIGMLPAKVFCLKADYAEATGTHNTQNANLIDTLYSEQVPPQASDSKIRTTVYGFPCVIFHQATENDVPVFVGKYNFNYDKGAENVFGFKSGTDVECWEFCNNTSDACNFKGEIPEDYSDDFESRYPDDENAPITRFKAMHDWVVSTRQDTATGDALAESYTDCDGTTHTVDNAAYRLAKFKTEFEDHFDLHYTAVYYVYTFFALMVDQRAKNMFMTYWGSEEKWYPYFYDNDTCFGINNEGQLVFDYWHEDSDQLNSANVYNGQNSVLWTNFKQAFASEIKSCYQTLRNRGKLTYDILIDYFVTHGAKKWSASIYNEDGEYKYISMLRDGDDASNLYQVRGSGVEHLKYFLENRINYCDSKWYASDYANDIVSLRIYTPSSYSGVTPNANITVTPYSDIYAGVRYKANGTLQQTRATKNVAVTFQAPNETFNDTETAIYGASNLSSLGDLAPLYCGSLDVSKANKLTSLKVGDSTSGYSNQNLTNLSLGSNKLLKTLDVRNCPNLVAPLNLANCPNIEEVYAEGTGITGVILPTSGYLKKLHLPATIVDLTIKNQLSLTDLSIAGYTALRTLTVENCPNIDGVALAQLATNLTHVRLTGLALTWQTVDTDFIDFFSALGGIDDNGLTTATAVLSGTLYVTSLTGAQYAALVSAFPYLTITYGTLSSTITYKSEDGTSTLYSETIYNGANASNPVTDGDISAPTKASTAQYSYTFSGWSLTSGGAADASALNAVTADRVVYAAFTSTLRTYTVVFKNDDEETVLASVTVSYGSNATYPNSTPTSTKGDYEFTGWDPAPTNIQANTTCIAQYNAPKGLDDMSWDEISAISAAGTGANYFDVGDCKAVTLNGTVGTLSLSNVTLYVYILGFNHNSAVEGTGISFGCFKTAIESGVNVALCDSHYGSASTDGSKWFNMNHSANTNSGGWKGCDMRYDILGSVEVKNQQDATSAATSSPVENTLMAALPSALRAVMKPITKYTDNVGGGTDTAANVTTTVDYLPLLAEKEIFGSRSYANSTEQSHQAQYAFYANGNSKVKYNHSSTSSAVAWWERSAYYNNSGIFCRVNDNGNAISNHAQYSYGVAPAFLV